MLPTTLFDPDHKAYIRSRGRLTRAQSNALESVGARFIIDPDQLLDFTVIFGSPEPPIMEIGFGVGQAIAAMAEANPDKNYLGVEVYSPGVGALLMQCQERELENVRIIQASVWNVLSRQVADASLSQINIFFPDPWPKTRHFKRRLLQVAFLELLAKKLVPRGRVYLATDWEDYAQWALKMFSHVPAFTNIAEREFIPRYDARPLTRFEQRGLKLGHEVSDLCFQRSAD